MVQFEVYFIYRIVALPLPLSLVYCLVIIITTVFKQLSRDADGVRFADLRDAHTRLEGQMEEMSAELRKLRPLTAENEKIKMQARLNEAKVKQLQSQLETVRLVRNVQGRVMYCNLAIG